MRTVDEIITHEGLRRKSKHLGISSDGRVRQHHLTTVRFRDYLYDKAVEWCEAQFNDDWIWARDPNNSEWLEILFLKPEHAFLFKLTFDTI